MYSPKIKPDLIPELYKIKTELKQPMTKVVDRMVRQAIRRWKQQRERNNNHEDNTVNSPTSPEGSTGV
jgi:hypothetical protein